MRNTSWILLAAATSILGGCGVATWEAQTVGMKGAPLSPAPEAPPGGEEGPPMGCEDGVEEACATWCGVPGTRRCEGVSFTQCTPPKEICDNGVDDDCDGLADNGDSDCPAMVFTCELAEGTTCNGDEGAGDKCDPMENSEGCGDARFIAWCNRTNPARPGIFDAYARDFVARACDGTPEKTGAVWSCLSSGNYRYECAVR